MSQGPKPGTMHGAGVGVPAPVVQTHPLGHGSHACTCFYVVTHTIHHILRRGDGGHLPVCGFAIPIGNAQAGPPRPMFCSHHHEGVRAGGVNAPISQRGSQSLHQAWVEGNRAQVLADPWVLEVSSLQLLFLAGSLELCAPARRKPRASNWQPKSSRNRLPRIR